MKKNDGCLSAPIIMCIIIVFCVSIAFAQDVQPNIYQGETNNIPAPPTNSNPDTVLADTTTHKVVTIRGHIVNEKNEPVAGVSVAVQGVGLVSTSGDNGAYKVFNIPTKGEKIVLTFSYLGYATQNITTDPKDATSLNIILKETSKDLDEVVVVGYSTQKKSDITGAVAVVDSKNFNTGYVQDPMQQLEGKATGVVVTQSSGDPNGNVSVRLHYTNNIHLLLSRLSHLS